MRKKQLKEKTVIIGGLKVRYFKNRWTCNKETMVFLHGWNSYGESWFGLVRKLGKKYNYLIPDLPGFGESEDMEKYGLNDYSRWVKRLLINIRVRQKITVVGTSYGGDLSVNFAVENNQQVKRLIIINPGILHKEDLNLGELKLIRGLMVNLYPQKEKIIELLENNQLLNSSFVLKRVKKMISLVKFPRASRKAYVEILPTLLDWDLVKMIRKVGKPVRIIFGRNDFIWRNISQQAKEKLRPMTVVLEGQHRISSFRLSDLGREINSFMMSS